MIEGILFGLLLNAIFIAKVIAGVAIYNWANTKDEEVKGGE